MDEVKYSFQHPADFQELYNLYEELGWNKLKLSKEDLEKMCRQRFSAIWNKSLVICSQGKALGKRSRNERYGLHSQARQGLS